MRCRITMIATAAVSVGLTVGCSAAKPLEVDPARTSVEYTFRDSSVPPEYHRSYVIKASSTQATITVDSYGDVLRQESSAVSAETWTKVTDLVRSLPERTKDIKTQKPGCAGGTASKIVVREGDEERYSRHIEDCGGGPVAPLTDTTAPLEALFDMTDLLKTSG
jgi:hypothetical protein